MRDTPGMGGVGGWMKDTVSVQRREDSHRLSGTAE